MESALQEMAAAKYQSEIMMSEDDNIDKIDKVDLVDSEIDQDAYGYSKTMPRLKQFREI